MTFAAKLSIATTTVVVVALAVAAAVAGPAARESYIVALRNTLAAQVDGAMAAQQYRVRAAHEEIDRIACAPRVVAALGAGDDAIIAKTAEDELRFALASAGPGATFLFLDMDDRLLAVRQGTEERARPIAQVLAHAVHGMTAPDTLYVAAGNEVIESVVAPVVDRAVDEQLGLLVLCVPFIPAQQLRMPDGEVLLSGLRIGDELFAPSMPNALRTATAAALRTAGSGEVSAQFAVAGEPMIAYAQPTAEGSATQHVAVASLAPTAGAVRSLMIRLLLGGAVALLVGLGIAGMMARALARPVADMSSAARAIERGDYSVRVPVRDTGELGELAKRFNEMGAGLALRDQYRRVLDVVTDPEVAEELLAGKLDLGGSSMDVGILFCDIRGFTALTEDMAPQDVITMLNAHMSLLTAVAYAHGGVVDKFVGDLIMVTFGAPKAAADDATRLARCALAMVRARAEANTGATRPIRIGIGCAYGTVVAGCMGSTQRLDYTVLGARVNLASRLCSKAPPMGVYIDVGVFERIPRADASELPPIEAKGFSRPIRAFELRGMPESPPATVAERTV